MQFLSDEYCNAYSRSKTAPYLKKNSTAFTVKSAIRTLSKLGEKKHGKDWLRFSVKNKNVYKSAWVEYSMIDTKKYHGNSPTFIIFLEKKNFFSKYPEIPVFILRKVEKFNFFKEVWENLFRKLLKYQKKKNC